MESLQALSNELAGAVTRAAASTVGVNARRRLPSTGVHWRTGIVVTADHTVKVEEGMTVTGPDGRAAEATVIGRDATTDLAVLRVAADGLTLPELVDGATLRVGHIVLALGRGPAASWGVISALGGSFRTWSGGHVDRFIGLDLTLYPGFSGGPLVDPRGRVIGINTSGLSRHVALTIPAATVDRVVDELVSKGRIARPYLGIAMQPVRLPAALGRVLGRDQVSGVMVLTVEPDGPAGRAGVLIGDVLVGLADAPVGDTDDVQSVLAHTTIGAPLRATLIRAGAPIALSVTVGERPSRRG